MEVSKRRILFSNESKQIKEPGAAVVQKQVSFNPGST
jgi:hypothetical protein